ncbi:hypothetical protein F511_44761 [Dorcoceras hygrometricum]|uniref:Uncharacterized protein n=1 Tax=Dorcoceras hygrometricum TaxID=472368 RepID=A0A2Z7B3Y0_9LAMI|nr:hypothetical protein F511_44761 [Dorcoceras hygrometricum]
MSTTTASSIRTVSDAIDSTPESSEVRGPWLPDQAELGSKNASWYEEKSSNLKSSDIPFIREKGGCLINSRWSSPAPRRGPISLLGVSILFTSTNWRWVIGFLSRAVLLCYHGLPLVPYVLMQLIQIKLLGSGKFYLSHKGDHAFIKGNPSSHKVWMSRFLFVRRVGKKRNPWKCDMHWRDNVFTLSPRTPDRAPNLAPFLEAMHGGGPRLGGSRSPQEGDKEEECPFRGREGGPWEEAKEGERFYVGGPKRGGLQEKPGTDTPTPTSEEAADVHLVRTTTEASSSGKGPERGHPLDPSKDSLVESPSAVAATRYICNMAPDRDLKVLREADNAEVIGHFSANISSAVAWVGEMVKRLTRAHRKATASRQRLDEALCQHAEVLARLEDLEAHRAREGEEGRIQREALEAKLAFEKEARAAEKAAREALEAELEEVKARAAQEAEQLKSEAKEEFLKSPEFNVFLGQRA